MPIEEKDYDSLVHGEEDFEDDDSHVMWDKESEDNDSRVLWEEEYEDEWTGTGIYKNRLTEKDVEDNNRRMIERQANFRTAADYVTDELKLLPEVEKIVLFGSVAKPLKKEIPRFREYRRARIAIWHECMDLDLALWVNDLTVLKRIQKARQVALDKLEEERRVCVATHQVELFIMDTATGHYVGCLCRFNKCPKDKWKIDCLEPGCGETKFLKIFEGFEFNMECLNPERSILLYESD